MEKLGSLVDGLEAWSHRKRLHKLETDDRAVEIATEVLQEVRKTREHSWNRVREWGALVIAAIAIVRPWERW